MKKIVAYVAVFLAGLILVMAYWNEILLTYDSYFGPFRHLSNDELQARISSNESKLGAILDKIEKIQSHTTSIGDQSALRDLEARAIPIRRERDSLLAEQTIRPRRLRYAFTFVFSVSIFLFLFVLRKILIERDPRARKKALARSLLDAEIKSRESRKEREIQKDVDDRGRLL